jgi:hypothetical protein
MSTQMELKTTDTIPAHLLRTVCASKHELTRLCAQVRVLVASSSARLCDRCAEY